MTTGSGRPTLEVVAARAGVSRATASRVLRGASNVSPQAREAVLRAAGQIDYRVNRAARSLVTRRTDSVAFLIAEDGDRMFTDPYFHGILRGAQAEVAAAGKQLVFAVASTPDEAAKFEHFAGSAHVDGVLLVSLHKDNRLAQDLEAMGVPTVLNGRPFDDDAALFSVDADNVGGAHSATAHLLARGARRIATITGPMDMSVGRDRLRGYAAALAEHGLTPEPALQCAGDFTAEGGAAAMRALLQGTPTLDGVFAASDAMAVGALAVLARAGRDIPTDVAVVGFDDIDTAATASPPLTTVRQPVTELGRTMARVLLARLAAHEGGAGLAAAPDVARRTVLPTELVLRASA